MDPLHLKNEVKFFYFTVKWSKIFLLQSKYVWSFFNLFCKKNVTIPLTTLFFNISFQTEPLSVIKLNKELKSSQINGFAGDASSYHNHGQAFCPKNNLSVSLPQNKMFLVETKKVSVWTTQICDAEKSFWKVSKKQKKKDTVVFF